MWGGMPELDLQKCIWDGCGWAPHCWIPPPPQPQHRSQGTHAAAPGARGGAVLVGWVARGRLCGAGHGGAAMPPVPSCSLELVPKLFGGFGGGGAARCGAALAQDPAPPPGSAPPPAPSSTRAHPLALIPHTAASGLPNSPSLSIPGSLLPSPSRRIPGGTESSGPPWLLGTPGLPSLHPFLG